MDVLEKIDREMERAREERFEKMLEQMREEEKIRCPHCGLDQKLDFCDGEYPELVTYWGGDDSHVLECVECEQEFKVMERVRRTFDVAKIGESFY